MRDREAFQDIDGELFSDISQDTFLLVESLLVSTDQATITVDFHAAKVLAFVGRERAQHDFV